MKEEGVEKEEGVLGFVVWLVFGFVEVRGGERVWVFVFVFVFLNQIKRKGKRREKLN